MVATVTTKSVESPVCPGSGTFPDVVNDVILDELNYVCATCGASMPNFEATPVHRHGLGGISASVTNIRDAPDSPFRD